jgi:hypothetical protein
MNKITESLLNAKSESKTHIYMEGVVETDISQWQDFFTYIEKTKVDGNYRSDFEGFYILNNVQKDDLYKFANAQYFDDSCADAYEEPVKSHHGFSIVLSELSKDDPGVNISGIMKHTDPHDTIHLNYVGESIWNIYDTEGTHTYHLKPGDVIWVRADVEHEVSSVMPRAGIIFCAG